MPDAFAALGVGAELSKTAYTIGPWGGTQAEYHVASINDRDASFSDYFSVNVMKGDTIVSTVKCRYDARPFELNCTPVKIQLRKEPATYDVVTELHGRKNKIVRSYRQLKMVR